MSIDPKEGDIVYFFYDEADKNKYAVNLEPLVLHKNKDTFNGVIITSKHTDAIYPGDHLLEDGTLPLPSKAICDQIFALSKERIERIASFVSESDLKEIRKKAAKNMGIDYKGTTLD